MKKADYVPWYCPVSGGKLYCRRYGNAPDSLLLVHGACVDADYFDETAVFLSSGYTVYTFDRRGYGRNRPDEARPLNQQADDIRLLLEKIGSRCVIVGHSAGYIPAARCMAEYPEAARGALFYEPFALDILPGKTDAEKISAVQKRIDAQDYFGAAALFSEIFSNEESDVIPAEPEITHLEKNIRCFFQNEYPPLDGGSPNASAAAFPRILLGLGNASLSTVCAEIAYALRAKYSARIIRYPGGHNCPRVHPKEFAEITGEAVRPLFEAG